MKWKPSVVTTAPSLGGGAGRPLLLLAAALAALLAAAGAHAAQDLELALGLESRGTYARWYQYAASLPASSRYFEEDFSLQGLRAEVRKPLGRRDKLRFAAGGSLAYYPLGSYDNGVGGDAGASGLRLSALGEAALPVSPTVEVLLRGELAYLLAWGDSLSGDAAHDEGVTDYLLTVDGALGLRYRGLPGRLDSVSLLYSVSLVGLLVDTDTYVTSSGSDPDNEDWSNASLMLLLGMKL